MDKDELIELVARALATAHGVDPDGMRAYSYSNIIGYQPLRSHQITKLTEAWKFYKLDARVALDAYAEILHNAGLTIVPREPSGANQHGADPPADDAQ